MTPDRYERLSELFVRAIETAPRDRASFLESECSGEPDLLRELGRMVATHEQLERDQEMQGEREDAEPDDSLTGDRISHYSIIEPIGEGGMSVVYRGEDVELRRPVALKFLSPLLSHSREARERFLREARTAAAIDHPNVCPVFEINADGERPFIAMAYLDGQTVADRLSSGPMSVGDAVDVAIQACRGLEAAHSKGIIHRDIKPSNLMLVRPPTGGGRNVVKILDFGIASCELERTITQPGASLGTISYMSPEQISSETVDERTDLWSLGVTLYEMLAGRRAFDRRSMRELAAAIAGADPPPLTELCKGIPAQLECVVLRLLRKSPAERFQAASELRATLEEFRERTASRRYSAPVVGRPAKATARSAAVAGGILLSGLLGYWAFAGREAPESRALQQLKPTPLTTYPGVEAAPALSPDGSTVAFAWDQGQPGKFDLYVQRIGSYEPLRLTDTPEAELSPAWSPDGKRIAFLRADGADRKVVSLPASGGAEELILELPPGSEARYLDWSPRGDILAVDAAAAILGVRLANPQAPAIHYEGEGTTGDHPRFDPSGERLAFLESRSNGAIEFVVVPASGDRSAARRFRDPRRDASAFPFTWSSDGKRLIYSHYRESSFFALRLDDGVVEDLPITAQGAWEPHIRGDRLVYSSRIRWSTNIWEADLAAARETQEPQQARPLIESTQRDRGARLSPDGASIVFASDRSGAMELWRCDRDGGNLEKLTSAGVLHLGSPAWSPEGAWIAFDAVIDERERDIYVVSARGGPARRVTSSPARDIVPSWSADGRWIYFASDRAGGFDVWKVSPQGDEAERVTIGGGFETIPTLDGRYLYYVRPDPHVVRRRDLKTGEEVEFPELGDAAMHRFWHPADDGIYFLDSESAPNWIQFLDFATKSTRKVCPFRDREPGPRQISVSPDGGSLIFMQRDEYGEDIMLVEGVE